MPRTSSVVALRSLRPCTPKNRHQPVPIIRKQSESANLDPRDDNSPEVLTL